MLFSVHAVASPTAVRTMNEAGLGVFGFFRTIYGSSVQGIGSRGTSESLAGIGSGFTQGVVTERPKVLAWKASVRVTVPLVRIQSTPYG